MLLYINGKFTMGKLKSYLLSECFVLHQPSLSIGGCRSRYEVDLVVYVTKPFFNDLVIKFMR
jgi:hypothetical protein